MARSNSQYDVLLVGGGVIGLSLAWELSEHGAKVCVLDRGELGKEASWSGAGMIPAGPSKDHGATATPFEQLAGMSEQLHVQWHGRLAELTGIDNGYRQCGTLFLSADDLEGKSIRKQIGRWRELGIECQELDAPQLTELEPALAKQADQFTTAFHVPAEAQFRSPRHMRALIAACRMRGVDLRPSVAAGQFKSASGRITSVDTSEGPIQAEHYCLTAGCWTGQLAKSLGLDLPVRPIHGQIVLLNGPAGLIRRNIYVDMLYLTPRPDGRLLVGSTLEDVGFLKQNTVTATAELMRFATSLSPSLAKLPIEAYWSGLRPGTPDGFPYLGRVPAVENGWIAAGHYRAGFQLAPATAVVMRALLQGETPPVDVASFGVERVPSESLIRGS